MFAALDGHRLAAADAPAQAPPSPARRAVRPPCAPWRPRAAERTSRGVDDRALRVRAAAERGDRHARPARPGEDDPRDLLGADRRARVVRADASAVRRQQVREAHAVGAAERDRALSGNDDRATHDRRAGGDRRPRRRERCPGSATDATAIGAGPSRLEQLDRDAGGERQRRGDRRPSRGSRAAAASARRHRAAPAARRAARARRACRRCARSSDCSVRQAGQVARWRSVRAVGRRRRS